MALTYADKLKYSTSMRQKFDEIKDLKQNLLDALSNDNEKDYEYTVNIIFGKVSVIETNIVNLKKEFMEKLNDW